MLLFWLFLAIAGTVTVETATAKTTFSSSSELISAVFLPRTRLPLFVISSKLENSERLFFILPNFVTTLVRYLKFYWVKIGDRQNG